MLLVLFGTPDSTCDDGMKIHARKTTRVHKGVKLTPSLGKGIPG
uniref:Uncharacterized protein n=1 Tax=Lepeophtheirus salmonis TaxID=72036 RepID=A0A0K2UKG6_LEPSM